MQAEAADRGSRASEDRGIGSASAWCRIVHYQHASVGKGERVDGDLVPTDRDPVFVEAEHREVGPSARRVAAGRSRCATNDEAKQVIGALRVRTGGNTNKH